MRDLTSRLAYTALALVCLLTFNIGAGIAKQRSSIRWKANWIWPSTAAIAVHTNQFVFFRKTFRLNAPTRQADLTIFADSRYRLYVNGSFVGQGPSRSPMYWGYYDVFDVTSLVRPGLNVIAVEIRWFGQSLAWYEPPPHEWDHGALLCQLNVNIGQKTQIVASDSTWKVAEDHAWDWDTPQINRVLSNIEVYHSDRVVRGWTEPQFDDSNWIGASVLKGPWNLTTPPGGPYPHLASRPMAYPVQREIAPAKVVEAGVIPSTSHLLSVFRRGSPLSMLGKEIANEKHDVRASILQNPQALTSHSSNDYAEIQPVAGQTPYVILDMGREVDGYLQFYVESAKPAKITIGWSEMMENGDITADDPGGDYVAEYDVAPGTQHWTMWGWHGLRFVELSFHHLTAPLRFRVGMLFSTAKLGHAGSFKCSSPLLTTLWQMGAYTWQLCTLDGTMDCPTREQHEWVGDGQVELLVNYAADGSLDIARKFFLDAARDQRQDGAIMPVSASDSTEVVADYEFSYINALYEYYLETGDKGFVLQLYPSVVRVMEWLHGFQANDGLLGAMPYRVSLDWFFSFDQQGESSTLNALYLHTLQNAAKMADLAGDRYHSRLFRERAARIRAIYDRRFWNVDRGLYVDGWQDGQQSEGVSQVANADAILYGLAPAGVIPNIVAKITDPAILRGVVLANHGYVTVKGETLDPTKDIVRAETYTMFFVLEALAKDGDTRVVEHIIETLWGPMAAGGNDTVWERFEQKEGTSCHAWSAAPTFILTRYILGVRPTRPGYKAYVVAPQPGTLSWAKGTIPTVRGTIEVGWRWKRGRAQAATASHPRKSFVLHLQNPSEASVKIMLPESEGKMPSEVSLNGRTLRGPVEITKPGTYSIEAQFK